MFAKIADVTVYDVTAGSMFRRCQSSGAVVRQSCDAAAAATRLTRRDGMVRAVWKSEAAEREKKTKENMIDLSFINWK